jgi:ABC-type branched-subunit amino acid transport system ATPase component
MTADPILKLDHVSVKFGGLTAVNDVSLSVQRGEICGIIGPNGAGKSTLFNAIAGWVAPTSGHVSFDGVALTGTPAHLIARLGISRAFQLVNLFPTLSVFENILVGAERHDAVRLHEVLLHAFGFGRRRAEAEKRAASALELTGIEGLAGNAVETLTYGQQRIVATARAMAAEPKVLLLDEPAAGLSESERNHLVAAIRRTQQRGVTVVLVEHNMNFVMNLCDHVAVLHFGKKICDGPPEQVRADSQVIEAYLGT